MQVLSQLEATFPRAHQGKRSNVSPQSPVKQTPPSSGGGGGSDRPSSSSADLLADELQNYRSPSASAILPVLPVRSSGSTPQYEKNDLRYWGVPDSV
jgi:hypothetical protein